MDFKIARILITGGAGFMGSHVVRYWHRRYPQAHISVLDKLTYAGNKANLKDITGKNFRFIKGDILDKRLVNKIVENIDIVFNFAAETHVDRSIDSGESFVKTDVLGTYILLNAVRMRMKPIYRFIQISTDEVFGDIKRGTFNNKSPFLPNSPYSASKAGSDLLCRAFYKTYKLPIVTTHSCNVYGPYQFPEKIIPLCITNLLMDKKIPLYNKGKNIREWIYVEDYVRALEVISKKAEIGKKVLIGSGERFYNDKIVNTILKCLKKDSSYIEHVADRSGHDFRYAVDHSWLTKNGWKPRIPIERGINKTVIWYLKNPLWWKPLRKKMHIYYKKHYNQARS